MPGILTLMDDLTGSVERITYYNEEWNFYDEEYDGIRARVIQHEYDHLNGVLFIDRIPPIRKKLIKGKLNDISKCKVDVSYKIKVIAG